MDRIRVLTLVGLTVVSTFGALGAASAQVVEGEEHCVVNVASWDRLNVRDEPSSTGNIVTKHSYGDCGITVTSEVEHGWVRIEDGHYEGWVKAKYISMVSPSMYCVSGVTDGDTLNLRAYPSTISRIVTELDPDQCNIAFLPYATNGWQKVRVEGFEGWVNRKYVSGE